MQAHAIRFKHLSDWMCAVQGRLAALLASGTKAFAAEAPMQVTPEKQGRQRARSPGQASTPGGQKMSPGRLRMARELAEKAQWLAEAEDHIAALELQKEALQVSISVPQNAAIYGISMPLDHNGINFTLGDRSLVIPTLKDEQAVAQKR